MKSIYLLTAFVAATALFFYLAGNFHQTSNLFDVLSTDTRPTGKQENAESPAAASGTKKFIPLDFRGPTGQPSIIGPQGPPPNY